MKKPTTGIVSVLALLCLSFSQTFACTTFCLKKNGEVLFGKNYDWMIGDGLVFVNKRGIAKVSNEGDLTNPAKWVSKYGSVTFSSIQPRESIMWHERGRAGCRVAGLNAVSESRCASDRRDLNRHSIDSTIQRVQGCVRIAYECGKLTNSQYFDSLRALSL